MEQEVKQKYKTVCWPDIKPINDWTGREQFELTFIQPLYKVIRSKTCSTWYYLCECSCGEEAIISANRNFKSCGHIRREVSAANMQRCNEIRRGRSVIKEKPVRRRCAKPKPFKRSIFCIDNRIACVYYSECQDERLSGKKYSSRYKSDRSCYLDNSGISKLWEGE